MREAIRRHQLCPQGGHQSQSVAPNLLLAAYVRSSVAISHQSQSVAPNLLLTDRCASYVCTPQSTSGAACVAVPSASTPPIAPYLWGVTGAVVSTCMQGAIKEAGRRRSRRTVPQRPRARGA